MMDRKGLWAAACVWMTMIVQPAAGQDAEHTHYSPLSKVTAANVRTGRELWVFDPKVAGAWARKACCDVVNRGVAVSNGNVYVGTVDGYLVALNARDGRVKWRVDTLTDRSRG
ncbi:hypothetical protein GCM10011487_14020 [Steroidobacter agaridevorans]|uniref:Pyrrolo-quinoline quinone repeat domain-containing protein n=1 Tax=Steroidobacter agaridevorans TaxID=2695856 RepID=A0A829Y9U9_9GAMM|nr:PQQ-binding-like beta-propeller repeat protein [Steroidobacter agaridevorans]GFE79402.1 hypothetical protein GCM10011487_14020 [Steroidobacter agaridevorans]GFE88407.1 hypothetical protein GCM10011488_33610 [Steroidobacter agaridevorans]